jgi:TetR/AcrR family transcriptional repressor of lmrAB and yxaGH operons
VRRDSRAELVKTMAQLMRDKGYTATGRAELLAKSGVSNGSLYHHFPGGMEQLAEAALEASGQEVAEILQAILEAAPDASTGLCRFLDIVQVDGTCPGCPVTPTALESPIVSPRLQAVAARCFAEWERVIVLRLREDGWRESSAGKTASALLALIEGALLLSRVSGDLGHLENAKRATVALLGTEMPATPLRPRQIGRQK